MPYSFIQETSNKHKIQVFLITLISIIVLLGAIISLYATFKEWFASNLYIVSIKQIISNQITSLTPGGLFYAGFIGGLFFIPIPQELFYYYGLMLGNPIILSLITVNAGFLLSQAFNYYVGSKLHKPVLSIISKKRVYKSRRAINKYGSLGIFLFNFLPLPAALVTFALGIAKYNVYRLMFYIILGTIAKYVIIIGFFILTTQV